MASSRRIPPSVLSPTIVKGAIAAEQGVVARMASKRPRLLIPVDGLALDATQWQILREHFDVIESQATGGEAARLDLDGTQGKGRPGDSALEEVCEAGIELLNKIDPAFIREQQPSQRIAWLEDQLKRVLTERQGFKHFEIRVINTRTQQLELVIAVGLAPLGVGTRIYAAPEGNGICGYVATTGRTYLCRDAQSDPRYITGLEDAGSALTVPLRIGGQVIGVLNIESPEKDAFTDEDVAQAEAIAPYIAVTLRLLNLLLTERASTHDQATRMIQDEVGGRLDVIRDAATTLRDRGDSDAAARVLCDSILASVEQMRSGLNTCRAGASSLLGVEGAMKDTAPDSGLIGCAVLVVDDDEVIRATIERILTASGCTVLGAADGRTALRFINSAGTESPQIHAVITDVKLPDLSGYEVFRHTREHFPKMPVILMTGFGYDPHHSIMRASQEGLQSILFKPFRATQLIEEMQRACGILTK